MSNGKKILIVEDDAIAGLFLEESLKDLGFKITDRVIKGEQAILSVAKTAPDVILMDIQLAGVINGIQAMIKIRSFSNVSVIFLTGFNTDQYRMQANQVHPLAFLIKPVVLQELLDVIH